MRFSIIVSAFFALAASSAQADDLSYGAAVTYERGECMFWTGDVGFTADQFLNDLKERFDSRGRLFVTHQANVPTQCVEIAIRSARLAGFTKVEALTRADAGPVGPPIDGS